MFEGILSEKRGDLFKSVIGFSKMWRKDKHLRQLEAMMIVLNQEHIFILSGTGDVVEPEDGKIAAIGSGGNYAISAARALDKHTDLDPRAFSKRLESLATRAQRADNLVRTQIEMGVQIQNKNLLESMELRARAQLRLQETVESLSIVAITYYIIGLLSTLVDPINFDKVFFSKQIFLAFCVPIILILIWFIAKMVRKKINKIK